MRNAHVRYMCFPSVACTGVETEVVVFPRDTSRVFRSEWEYSLGIVGMWDDEVDYMVKDPLNHPYEIRNGCLVFRHVFDREQEYSIRFFKNGEPETRISMYAVDQDLHKLRPLKGDFHTHTYYSDGQDGVAMTASDYREEGFDFVTVTDHNRMFTSTLIQEMCDEMHTDLCVIRGEEVHTPGSALHIVHAGGKESVCSRYIKDGETYENEIRALEKRYDHVPEIYRTRMAKARWACDKIHEAGGLAIFAHPFWSPNRYNISGDFQNLLFDERMFDAFELIGGCGEVNNNLHLAQWQDQQMKGNVLPAVGSSDSHNHDFESAVFARAFTIVFARENTPEAILEAVKNGWCVAGEIPGEMDKGVRFYGGSLRLVMFAHFLYKNYFNETWKLCVGEGVLMRRYVQGENIQDVLAALKDSVPGFYRRYYGIDPAPVLPPDRIAFLDKCLQQQREIGPITKGSKIVIYGQNQRRE
ncbi:MAG: CehA/McbA family metallohydrolase [Clostridia bacterium]|nr:CehA/McbA family metallohydrolase [Clostridia bacterium]